MPDYLSYARLPRMRAILITTLFLFPNSTSWSMEATLSSAYGVSYPKAEENNTFTTNSPQPSMVDPCLPLLKKIRHTTSPSAMDRTRRSADKKAAMLGLVLGLRVALGPKEVLRNEKRVSVGPQFLQNDDMRDSYALAVSDYRRCKNEQALKALNDNWRWRR